MISYANALFDDDFLFARRADGLTVRFTRSERLVLKHLAENSGRLLSRNQLLDALTEPGSDRNDRSIDFLMARLRAKLNDSATRPVFIATRYGEGYLWIAPQRKAAAPAAPAFIRLHPARAPEGAGADVDEFAAELRDALAAVLGSGRPVAVSTEAAAEIIAPETAPRYGVGLTAVPRPGGGTDGVISVRQVRTGRMIAVRRLAIDGPRAAAEAAAAITAVIWKDEVAPPAPIRPMVVSLSEAGLNLTGDPRNWTENDRRLRAMLAETPDDPVLRLLLATNLQSRHIIAGPQAFLAPVDLAAEEREVEAIVTDILPQVQDDPVHAMAAARLLFFLGPAYRSMSITLAERVHQQGSTLAASFGTIGQMRACMGDIDAGIADYDVALGLTEPGSQYDLFLLVLKAQAQLAGDLRDGLEQTLQTAYARSPEMQFFMEPLCSPIGRPSPVALAALAATPAPMATAMLRYLHHSCTSAFLQSEHRLNSFAPAAALFTGHFGPEVMPPELLDEFGHLVAQPA
jgi:DNA-binding winged helix-turn-helix (wHTH) protein